MEDVSPFCLPIIQMRKLRSKEQEAQWTQNLQTKLCISYQRTQNHSTPKSFLSLTPTKFLTNQPLPHTPRSGLKS